MTKADPNFSRAANDVIRELESELVVYREPIPGLEATWRSRAEKLEESVQELGKLLAEKEARVAELEATLEEGSDYLRVVAQERDFLQRFVVSKGLVDEIADFKDDGEADVE